MATSQSSDIKTSNPSSGLSTRPTANRHMNMQRMQNLLFIWLDNNINDNNADCNNIIKQLKRVVNNVNIFTNGEECIEFIQTITNNKVCMIVSDSLGQHIVPRVHKMSQVDTIFIFSNNQECHKQWTTEWPKVKGVFTDIASICKALKQATHQCEQNTISISFVAPNKKLDQLDPSFMYTQILKEILLTINFEDKHFQEFITYYREAVAKNDIDLSKIEAFERNYRGHTVIWWYTSECFLYSMLNQALRLMDVDIILRIGFFINDLHRDIQRLYSEQFHGQQSGETLTVYRGQRLSKEEFTEMTNTKGGLLSFNNFLSTSKNRDVSLLFTPQGDTNPDLVGILFVMSINPSDSTTPFAFVSDVSNFDMEDEVLFSMHSIFRIGDIQPMEGNNHLYQVNLTLTNDNDQDLRALTDRIRQETFLNSTGWHRLGLLLIKMGQFNKAQEVYEVLLHQAANESDMANIYHQLGGIKHNQGEDQEALTSLEKALTIRQQSLPSNHPDVGDSYNKIGTVYDSMGNFAKALSYYEKALAIRQQSLPSNHPDLGGSYNNIGSVYDSMGDHPKALCYYEKDLRILQQSLPFNHPDLAISYNNIGLVYYSMSDYPKALLSHEKALAVRQQSLPVNHPHVGASYNCIGMVYAKLGDYPKALSYYEKALKIRQQLLTSNHPDLAASYNSIGLVYNNMGDYPKALSSHEKALTIRQQSFPSNHPDLGNSYSHIGLVYYNKGDYPKALSYYEKAHTILQQSLPSNHSDLALSYMRIGNLYNSMSDYPKALSSHEKALTIRQQSLSSNHPDLANSYSNIGLMYNGMGDYPKALSSHEKALTIRHLSLPSNHPSLGVSYYNIGLVYNSMGDYPKALSYYEKALAIQQQSLTSNHPDLAASYNSIGVVYENMGNYSKAHSFYERAVKIGEQSLPTNHPDLKMYRGNLENIKTKL
ncbi:unnamed protein product [Adineta steineri]|uniref:ADP ribosyltransferase domain-containing protein n=1 Tax=Adineta steineri TaxID=433720 RepID=A0A816EFS5_9BILA|nr:unnamed protein product [Adineta steineri]CAF1504565.1 unnamed protein product [Adineta steineri]CAF1645409.1 unnamed protein product [Adineta steineri]CAF1645422.1 unnamed protein product [Adineta steineri]